MVRRRREHGSERVVGGGAVAASPAPRVVAEGRRHDRRRTARLGRTRGARGACQREEARDRSSPTRRRKARRGAACDGVGGGSESIALGQRDPLAFGAGRPRDAAHQCEESGLPSAHPHDQGSRRAPSPRDQDVDRRGRAGRVHARGRLPRAVAKQIGRVLRSAVAAGQPRLRATEGRRRLRTHGSRARHRHRRILDRSRPSHEEPRRRDPRAARRQPRHRALRWRAGGPGQDARGRRGQRTPGRPAAARRGARPLRDPDGARPGPHPPAGSRGGEEGNGADVDRTGRQDRCPPRHVRPPSSHRGGPADDGRGGGLSRRHGDRHRRVPHVVAHGEGRWSRPADRTSDSDTQRDPAGEQRRGLRPPRRRAGGPDRRRARHGVARRARGESAPARRRRGGSCGLGPRRRPVGARTRLRRRRGMGDQEGEGPGRTQQGQQAEAERRKGQGRSCHRRRRRVGHTGRPARHDRRLDVADAGSRSSGTPMAARARAVAQRRGCFGARADPQGHAGGGAVPPGRLARLPRCDVADEGGLLRGEGRRLRRRRSRSDHRAEQAAAARVAAPLAPRSPGVARRTHAVVHAHLAPRQHRQGHRDRRDRVRHARSDVRRRAARSRGSAPDARVPVPRSRRVRRRIDEARHGHRRVGGGLLRQRAQRSRAQVAPVRPGRRRRVRVRAADPRPRTDASLADGPVPRVPPPTPRR